MLALCLMLSMRHYAQNYAGIISGSIPSTDKLQLTHSNRNGIHDCTQTGNKGLVIVEKNVLVAVRTVYYASITQNAQCKVIQ